MCFCPLHDNRNGVNVCTCLCQEHDKFFDQGVVLVRRAVRRYQRVAQDEIKGVHNRLGPGHSESDRKSCMSCRTSPVDCDRSRTYNSEACCQFCEVETFKEAHPVKKTTKPEETSGGPLRRERETDGELLARLGTDAEKWADSFVALFQGMTVGRADQADEGLMLSWFAAALEAGRSAGIDVGRGTALEEWQQHASNLEQRIHLAKDALMSSGYFEESDLTDDEIAPRIHELVSAHNKGFLSMQDNLNRQINKWKNRAVVAERRMSSVRQFVQDNLRVTQDEE